MKDYLQPIATLFVAIGLGFIAVDQYRTSNARFNCAQAFGNSEGSDKDSNRRLEQTLEVARTAIGQATEDLQWMER